MPNSAGTAMWRLVAAALAAAPLAAAERHIAVSATQVCFVAAPDQAAVCSNATGWAAVPGPFHGIAVGDAFACGLLTNGSATCWGSLAGVVPGTLLGGEGSELLDLHAGPGHLCALAFNGSVTCYGDNASGALNVPANVPFAGISAGPGYSCGAGRDGRLRCWGDATNPVMAGVPGDPSSYVHVAVGAQHACGLRGNGSAVCWGAWAAGALPPDPAGGYLTVTAGGNATCGLLPAGRRVECWGAVTGWQPGSVSEVACGGAGCVAVLTTGELQVTGGSLQAFNMSGFAWAATESQRAWTAVASSADGSRLVAAANVSELYVSADAGATWVPRDAPRTWSAVCSSADGVVLAAVVMNGQIYVSVDAGATWTARDSSRPWSAVACSANGTRLVATTNTGLIYTTTNTGASWTARGASSAWTGVASSADGLKLVAVRNAGVTYVSADAGVTWTSGTGSRAWTAVASSANFSMLVAAVANGQIFVSNDAGVSWAARESVRAWSGVTASADGTTLAAVVKGGQIYLSADAGVTWTAREGFRAWSAVSSSAGGTRVVAAVLGGQVHVSGEICLRTGSQCLATPLATSGARAIKSARMMSAPGSCAVGNDSVPAAVAAVTADRWAGWGPSLRSINLRAMPVSAIAPGAFASPGVAAVSAITNLTAANDTLGIRLEAGSFTGMTALTSINSGRPGVMNLAGLGVFIGSRGAFSWDALAGTATGTITSIILSGNNVSAILPNHTVRLDVVVSVTVDSASLQLFVGSFAGMASLDRINSGTPGVLDLSKLGVYVGSPGTWDWEALAASNTPVITEIRLSDNNITTFLPLGGNSTLTFPAATKVHVCTGNPGAAAAFRTARAFAAFPNIRNLDVAGGSGSTTLYLKRCGITTVNPDAFALPWTPGITTIDLTYNAIASIADVSAFLAPLCSLTYPAGGHVSLQLTANAINMVNDTDADALTNVRFLHLTNNNITFISAAAFSSLKHPKLFNFVLAGNPLESQPCPPSYFSSSISVGVGASVSTCPACPEGGYCTGNGQVTRCPAGRYNNLEGQASESACVECPRGTFNERLGQPITSCTFCPVGTSNPSSGSSSRWDCRSCSPGSFAAGVGLSQCTLCPPGTWANVSGAASSTDCTPCPLNTYSSAAGATSNDTCTPCAPGFYTLSVGSSSQSACTSPACPTGQGRDPLSGVCQDCTAGSYASASMCVACSIGSFSTQPRSTSCSTCDPGYYGTVERATSVAACRPCIPGTYNDLRGQPRSGCLPCPVGTASSVAAADDASMCIACGRGKYAALPGSATCTSCPAGTWSNATGATSAEACIPCPLHTWSAATGATTNATCLPCRAGTVTAAVGTTSAESCVNPTCPNGYGRSSEGDCIACAAGTFSVDGVCRPCTAGKYGPSARASSCQDCPLGTYSGAVAANSSAVCLPCPLGTVCRPDRSGCTAVCAAGTSLDNPASPVLDALMSECAAPTESQRASLCRSCSQAAAGVCVAGLNTRLPLVSAIVDAAATTGLTLASANVSAIISDEDAAAAAQVALPQSQFDSCGKYVTAQLYTDPLARYHAVQAPLLITTGVACVAVVAAIVVAIRSRYGERVRKALVQRDAFSTAHPVRPDKVVREAPTASGGVFSVAYYVAAVGLTASLLAQLALQPYVVTQSIVDTPPLDSSHALASVHRGTHHATALLIGGSASQSACPAVQLQADQPWVMLAATPVVLTRDAPLAGFRLPPAIQGSELAACLVTAVCEDCRATTASSLSLAFPWTYQSVAVSLTGRTAYAGCGPTLQRMVSAPSSDRLIADIALDVDVRPVIVSRAGSSGEQGDSTGLDFVFSGLSVNFRSDLSTLRPDTDTVTVVVKLAPTPYCTQITISDATNAMVVVSGILGLVSGLAGGFRMLVRQWDKFGKCPAKAVAQRVFKKAPAVPVVVMAAKLLEPESVAVGDTPQVANPDAEGRPIAVVHNPVATRTSFTATRVRSKAHE